MADLSFLSDSDDDRAAVDELLSQAMDHSVLEQVAAINCSGFSDSPLPSHLESRFRKLKSLPSTNPKPPNPTPESFAVSQPVDNREKEERTGKRKGPKENPSPDLLSPTRILEESGVKLGAGSYFEDPDDVSTDSPSPPAKAGCLWCSPNKIRKKKKVGKENRGVLSDLSSFSQKKHEEMLKRALREEEEISREAEKIVKWAKQASARMEFSGLDDDDELSDKEVLPGRRR
ncbi:unnamed protein product [Cuscuta epithymum]|uniref:Uncharacterized protein n=1 Tax=Cuscuta epithymum TaxID=186058 RepID=A0AAV0EDE8_9ASTE|nr:unnamed protein product [Cuscuta epithymum]